MSYIVLDLEFNQPFPFRTGRQTTLNPECPFEIIQIGAVKLNDAFEKVDDFNFLIKPQIYKRIHPYVEKITGITFQQIEYCPSFTEAFQSFIDFIGIENSILCTWGIDDIKSLFRNILYYNLDTNLISDQYINVQNFATNYLNYEQGKTIGLKNAVVDLKIEIEANFHNALHDAEYTAEVFKIVCPEILRPETFQILDLAKRKQHTNRINIKDLTQHFENKISRKLTAEELCIIKESYKLGRNQAYDLSSDKYKPRKKGGC